MRKFLASFVLGLFLLTGVLFSFALAQKSQPTKSKTTPVVPVKKPAPAKKIVPAKKVSPAKKVNKVKKSAHKRWKKSAHNKAKKMAPKKVAPQKK